MPSFDYTSRDYLSIRQDLLDRASAVLPEWSNRNSSDFGMVFVDLWAYMGDILHYYVDRAAAETYIGTANNKSSILALANLFDYRPAYQTASTGTVTLAATNPTHSDTITIPINTGFIASATDNLPVVYFTTTASASMGPSVSSVVVQVGEGIYEESESPVQTVTRNTYSNGTSGQRFNLRYTGVITSTVSVFAAEGPTVSGSPSLIQYFYTSDLSSATSTDKVFTVEIASDGVAQITFGNGINGKIPENTAEITVSYRRGQGAVGNIGTGRITAFDAGSSVSGAYIASSSSTSGGTDSESLESMKTNIPLMFRTQDRAVSLQDFKDLALRIPQVVKSTCTVSGTNVTVYGVPYQADYLTTTATSLTIPSYVKDEIIAYFKPRSLVGASVIAASSITLTPVNVTVSVTIKSNYVSYWVSSAVSEIVDSFFDFDNVSFDQVLSLGSLYRAIQSVEGVDYANITVFNTTTSGTVNTLTPASGALLRRGTIAISTSGGITGIIS